MLRKSTLILGLLIITALVLSGDSAIISGKTLKIDIKNLPMGSVTTATEIYKTIGTVKLNAYIYYPPNHRPSDKRPCILLFFGGGWTGGNPAKLAPQAIYLASRGMVAITPDYRVKNPQGTTPKECVKDGNSALRLARKNAARLGIDPARFVASGPSAGGHVAAATETALIYDEPGEDLSISSDPNALVLFNPVYDNGPGPPPGYGYDTVKAYWRDISPNDNIRAPFPPHIVFLGTSDDLIPVATALRFQSLAQGLGARSDLKLYDGREHGFFNSDQPDYLQVLGQVDDFLVSIGYLQPKP
jgi:acetyl esterase